MLASRTLAPRGFGRVSPLAPRPVARSVRGRAVPGADPQAPLAAPAVDAASVAPTVAPVVAPVPETVATYALPPNAAYYPGVPMRQDYYMAAPPPGAYYPPPPPAPYKEEAASTGAPWWIWLGIGVILGQVLAKVQEFMKNPKTPQQIMMEMAMKQMQGAMGTPPPGGMPPFGAAPGGASPFAQYAAAAAASSPTVETTASSIPPSASTSSPSSSSSGSEGRKGEKFASRLSSEGREARKPEPAAAGAAAAGAASKPLDVVEPVVKEPSSSSGGGGGYTPPPPPRSSFFADVDAEAASAGPGSGGASSSGGAGGAATSNMSDMMEAMLRNPEMQKMLYPYLPEPMRNPQSIEWMLSNPEVKKQMEQMFAQQNVMSPQMMDMMKNMDFNQDRVNQQFAELGLKPEDVITKVMANPELAAGFSNPKVQSAIMDISQNPMNIVKYQNDPEVMKVLEKVTEIFGGSPKL